MIWNTGYLERPGPVWTTEGEPEHELVWLPVEECREKMALAYQSWVVEMAWECYKKAQKEKLS